MCYIFFKVRCNSPNLIILCCLSSTGRQFRDFLNGLDGLHEYLRFSYPKIRPPSYYCNNESEFGMTLHYRSKRKDFLWYTIGQIETIGQHFYQIEVSTELLSQSYDPSDQEYYFVLALKFDNQAFDGEAQTRGRCKSSLDLQPVIRQTSLLPLKAESLFKIFPFCLVFDSDLKIKAVGHCLQVIMKLKACDHLCLLTIQVVLPNISGREISKVFNLVKPKVGYNWHSVSEFSIISRVLAHCVIPHGSYTNQIKGSAQKNAQKNYDYRIIISIKTIIIFWDYNNALYIYGFSLLCIRWVHSSFEFRFEL